MNTNIYDRQIVELFHRLGAGSFTGGGITKLVLSVNAASIDVTFPYNSNHVFTSQLVNIPSGYSITTSSHVISYPNAVDTVGSAPSISGGAVPVILGALNDTYIVTSTVTLEHATEPDIILTDSITITAVASLYYGVTTYTALPTIAGLAETNSTASTFILTSSSLGRLLIGIPVALPPLLSVTDNNGLVFPISDFTVTTAEAGTINMYQLNYDTIFSGSNIKEFTLNYV
jgi:hypothetical protein